MNAVVPLAIEGVKELYNLYKGNTVNMGKKIGINSSEVRMIATYNKNGRRLAVYK